MDQPVGFPKREEIPAEIWREMNISPEDYARVSAFVAEREKTAPVPGSSAPDFDLERLAPEGGRGGGRIRLADLRGRPVALVFGSYT
jgi:hypothetical protein